jgi:hypothetical protein
MVMKKYITQKGKDSLAASLPGLIRDKGWEKQLSLIHI